ncbi:hypothetical protein HS121_16360 [bacterium]|nr:hypothetical protein [bacterium]
MKKISLLGRDLSSHLCERFWPGERWLSWITFQLEITSYRPLESHPGFTCIVDEVQNDALMEQLIRTATASTTSQPVWSPPGIERPTECLVNNIIGTEVVLR